MALKGSFSTNGNTYGMGITFSWSATQNASNNKSTINWSASSFGQTSNYYNYAGPVTITVAGSTVYSNTDRFKMYGNGNWSTSGSVTVNHNADGTATFSASISAAIYTYAVNCTGSGSWTLDTIATTPSAPTACSITAGNGNYVGLGDTVTISWSGASGTITGYDIQYSRGNSGWKDYKSVGKVTSTTDSFTSTDINVNGAGKAVQYRVRAKNGSYTSGWKTSNTLYVSGAMDIKVSNAWKTGSTWIKVGGEWKRAKRVWIKINGTWQQTK